MRQCNIVAASLLLSTPALAVDGGFNKANETLSNTSTGLLGLAAVTITLATMWWATRCCSMARACMTCVTSSSARS